MCTPLFPYVQYDVAVWKFELDGASLIGSGLIKPLLLNKHQIAGSW
jgi:hypothetical protein